jgi:hypothetical protein
MTPSSDNPSPTPLHEPINAGIVATEKEAVQESLGPEARETPRSSLPVGISASVHHPDGPNHGEWGDPSKLYPPRPGLPGPRLAW